MCHAMSLCAAMARRCHFKCHENHVLNSTLQCRRFPEYELRPGGADITVDTGNCAAYVAAVVEATLGAGVSRQVRLSS